MLIGKIITNKNAFYAFIYRLLVGTGQGLPLFLFAVKVVLADAPEANPSKD